MWMRHGLESLTPRCLAIRRRTLGNLFAEMALETVLRGRPMSLANCVTLSPRSTKRWRTARVKLLLLDSVIVVFWFSGVNIVPNLNFVQVLL